MHFFTRRQPGGHAATDGWCAGADNTLTHYIDAEAVTTQWTSSGRFRLMNIRCSDGWRGGCDDDQVVTFCNHKNTGTVYMSCHLLFSKAFVCSGGGGWRIVWGVLKNAVKTKREQHTHTNQPAAVHFSRCGVQLFEVARTWRNSHMRHDVLMMIAPFWPRAFATLPAYTRSTYSWHSHINICSRTERARNHLGRHVGGLCICRSSPIISEALVHTCSTYCSMGVWVVGIKNMVEQLCA